MNACADVFYCLVFINFTGKYLLVRDPNKAQLRLYALPAGVVAAEESEGELDEGDADADEADE